MNVRVRCVLVYDDQRLMSLQTEVLQHLLQCLNSLLLGRIVFRREAQTEVINGLLYSGRHCRGRLHFLDQKLSFICRGDRVSRLHVADPILVPHQVRVESSEICARRCTTDHGKRKLPEKSERGIWGYWVLNCLSRSLPLSKIFWAVSARSVAPFSRAWRVRLCRSTTTVRSCSWAARVACGETFFPSVRRRTSSLWLRPAASASSSRFCFSFGDRETPRLSVRRSEGGFFGRPGPLLLSSLSATRFCYCLKEAFRRMSSSSRGVQATAPSTDRRKKQVILFFRAGKHSLLTSFFPVTRVKVSEPIGDVKPALIQEKTVNDGGISANLSPENCSP